MVVDGDLRMQGFRGNELIVRFLSDSELVIRNIGRNPIGYQRRWYEVVASATIRQSPGCSAVRRQSRLVCA